MWWVWGLRFLLCGHSRSTPVTCGSGAINASATLFYFICFLFLIFKSLFLVFWFFSKRKNIGNVTMWGVWGLRFLLPGHSRSTPVTCGSRGINASATFILFVFYFYFFSLLLLVFRFFWKLKKIFVMLQCEEFEG